MSTTLTPTSTLRLVSRLIIVPAEPGADMLAARGANPHPSTVLQQRFLLPSEQEVWQDVPHTPHEVKAA